MILWAPEETPPFIRLEGALEVVPGRGLILTPAFPELDKTGGRLRTPEAVL